MMLRPVAVLAMLFAAGGVALAQPPAVAAVEATPTSVAAVNRTIDQLLGDHAKYEPVIHAFQKAVAAKDAQAVAALVAYPLTVKLGGKALKIRDAKEFVAHYAAIVPPASVEAISKQAYGTLFVNDQGVMFGNGEAWINGICKDTACKNVDVKVVAFNPDAAALPKH